MEQSTRQTEQASSLLTINDMQHAVSYIHDFTECGYALLGKVIDTTTATFVLRHRRNGARIKLALSHKKIEVYRDKKLRKIEEF